MTDPAETESSRPATLKENAALHGPIEGQTVASSVRRPGPIDRAIITLKLRTRWLPDDTKQYIERRPILTIVTALAVGMIGGCLIRGKPRR